MNAESEPAFLSRTQVLTLHRISLAEHGGLEGIRDPGALDSALTAAQNTWHYGRGDLFDIAAAYAFHLAESQASVDGNKRTAITSAVTFLAANGCVDESNGDALYDAMLAIAKHQLDKHGLAHLFRRQFPKS